MENNNQEEKYQSIKIDNVSYRTHLTSKFLNRKVYREKEPKKITAFIPGTIRKVYVKEGQKIKEGGKLLTLEAMKMNNIITSPLAGKIKAIHTKQGKTVAKNELLIELE